MNSADQGGCYPQRLKAEVDITLANSSYPTKAEFNNIALLFIQNISLFLKEFLPFRSLFYCLPKIAKPHPQVFSVNSSIICRGLHF